MAPLDGDLSPLIKDITFRADLVLYIQITELAQLFHTSKAQIVRHLLRLALQDHTADLRTFAKVLDEQKKRYQEHLEAP